ncbi:V-set and immunoglobulin domain-containing protein 10 [Scleropages formosus]|uniref:V-set and immunoglobulin domain-containing protein 10 n=1 Tax=Scleropages formosus TaxID=113540 RepID=UPI000878AE6D|nr:V-set and immunoglobulin domain-containing protein 10 [Scleropages formosus]
MTFTMRRSPTATLLFLLLHATGVLRAQHAETLLGTLGEPFRLPCRAFVDSGNWSTAWIDWSVDNRVVANRNRSTPAASAGNARLSVSDSGSLSISQVREQDEGLYLCTCSPADPASQSAPIIRLLVFRDPVNVTTAIKPTDVVSKAAPNHDPECYSATGNDSFHILLHCTWSGGNSTPILHWTEEQGHQWIREPVLNSSAMSDILEVSLNRSKLYDGQTFKCTGHHQELVQDRSCSLTLKQPFPEGTPMVTAVVGNNVTLKCMESTSLPPATTTWKRTVRQEDIFPSSKYVISQEGPTFRLMIINVSREDEGIYFCRSENPLQVVELEIYLTVRSSAANTGAIFGLFIAVLILAVAVVVGTGAYQNRDKICLGNTFSNIGEERNDELTLVESDEDELFNDSVTRITTTANGHATSLVQIHSFPSSDHEDLADPQTEAEETPPSPDQKVDNF